MFPTINKGPDIMGDIESIPTNGFFIPLGQIVSYVFISTICFLLRRYKLGLMISYVYVFNWGFLYGSANFVDMMGTPNMNLFVYLASGFTMAFLILIGLFRKE
jgi:hypothetical protein